MANWLENRLSMIRKQDAYRYSVEGHTPNLTAKLDANENWHVPRSRVRAILSAAAKRVDTREYPDAAVRELSVNISRKLNLPVGCVVPCAGADQAIDLLCGAFLGKGERATIVSPTFSVYRLRAKIAEATCVEVPMNKDFTLPVGEIVREAGNGGILFICSPNNPTGNQFGEQEIVSILESFPGLVLLDEAYVEFANFSLSGLVKRRRNLAVLRTFSKAYGIAGLRLGYLLANEEWAPDFLERIQYPYPISSIATAMGMAMLARGVEVRKWIASVRKERAWLTRRLRRISGVYAFDSSANFLMASLPVSSRRTHAKLLDFGVATRDLGTILGFRNCLRITVGTRRMNQALLDGLAELIGNG